MIIYYNTQEYCLYQFSKNRVEFAGNQVKTETTRHWSNILQQALEHHCSMSLLRCIHDILHWEPLFNVTFTLFARQGQNKECHFLQTLQIATSDIETFQPPGFCLSVNEFLKWAQFQIFTFFLKPLDVYQSQKWSVFCIDPEKIYMNIKVNWGL